MYGWNCPFAHWNMSCPGRAGSSVPARTSTFLPSTPATVDIATSTALSIRREYVVIRCVSMRTLPMHCS